MEKPCLISVIVPVYKVEKYLDRCVQSIVDQTYKNLEIILVDDGSPDNCPAMCDAWAAKDSRIKVVHRENCGSGGARNIALDIALGEYIGMLDSDDYISPYMYEHLLSMLDSDVDIAECCTIETEADDAPLDQGGNFAYRVFDATEAMKLHIQDVMFRQTPPNKLYRRATIGSVRFPMVTRIDDEFWTYKVIGNAKKLAHSTARMYAYRQQNNSIMHTLSQQQRLQTVKAKEQRHEYITNNFPTLTLESLKSLWFTCLYQGQLTLLNRHITDIDSCMGYLRQVLKKHPMPAKYILACNKKEQIWLILASISLKSVCKLRNELKIGF